MQALALLFLGAVAGPTIVATEGDFVNHLQPLLKSFGGTARAYYAGACRSAGSALPFPRLKVEPPKQGIMGIDAVRQIFQNDRRVAIAQARSGLLRITIGNVPTAILQTKLSVLTFSADDQYNAQLAISSIFSAPQVLAAERSLRVYPPSGPESILFARSPPKDDPHLPSLMRNVTVDEVLDSVATTFKGVVVYGICTQPNGKGQYDLEFYSSTP